MEVEVKVVVVVVCSTTTMILLGGEGRGGEVPVGLGFGKHLPEGGDSETLPFLLGLLLLIHPNFSFLDGFRFLYHVLWG